MKVIRYIDIMEPFVNENGEMEHEVVKNNLMVPCILDAHKVDSIYPLFTREGKLFKNISMIQYKDEMIKVLGSIDYVNGLRKNNTTKFIGFHNGQQKQETIEDRTEVESKPKRGTERSNK